jgi:hypothetical protein
VTAGRPPIISRPNKELVVQCPQTRDLMVGIVSVPVDSYFNAANFMKVDATNIQS